MSDLLAGVTPEFYGFKWEQYRELQREAVDRVVEDFLEHQVRFSACAVPTGGGKSLVAMTLAKMMGWRVCVLTVTKGLQTQYLLDFGGPSANRTTVKLDVIGGDELVDVRGRNNYYCVDVPTVTCEHGRHKCDSDGTGECGYYAAVTRARAARNVVTNYSFWLNIHKHGKGLVNSVNPQPFDLLVCDEAHLAPEEVAQFMGVKVNEKEIHEVLGIRDGGYPLGEELKEWSQWAMTMFGWVRAEATRRKKKIKQLNHPPPNEVKAISQMEFMAQRLETIATLPREEDQWVCEMRPGTRWGREWQFDCVWPGRYTEHELFLGVPHILLMSATLRPKTMSLLGVKEEDYRFHEWPRVFPKNRSPIYHLPTVRLNRNSSAEDLNKWLDRIDEIIAARLDRKGIIHTVAYHRQSYILHNSQFAKYMIGNSNEPNSAKAADVARAFRQAQAPCILVSPSFGTGWDFPYCLAPHTKVLTADLRYVPLGSLQVDDRIAGFDEIAPEGRRSRRWRETTVLSTSTLKLPCKRIILEDGTEFICTYDHMWLCHHEHGGVRWVQTRDLHGFGPVGSSLYKVAPTWVENSDWGSGYLAGCFDSEGSLCHTGNTKTGSQLTTLAMVQRDNELLFTVADTLQRRGYDFSIYPRGEETTLQLHINNRYNLLRFLGENRPRRLLNKFDFNKFGALNPARSVAIDTIEDAGLREVVRMETSTGTLVAEGFATHNCDAEWQIICKIPYPDTSTKIVRARRKLDKQYINFVAMQELVQSSGRIMRAPDDRGETFIIDDSIEWFLWQNRALAPKWFSEPGTVLRMASIPLPPRKL